MGGGSKRGAWKASPIRKGVQTYRMRGWRDFLDFIETVIFSPSQEREPAIVWRGQRDARWSLESSLDRVYRDLGYLKAENQEQLEARARGHLEVFKRATLGLRGENPKELDFNEWWALGQHYGLATPLLDWTRSPFAALYFAFEEAPPKGQSEFRTVWGLYHQLVDDENVIVANAAPIEGRPRTLDFIDPLADDNPRLVSQGAVLTRGPIGLPVEKWVAERFSKAKVAALLRIEIPASDRVNCLLALDRMNINHISLFPDLSGASRCANLRAELRARRVL